MALRRAGGVTALCVALSACTTPMRISTHHQAATVYVDGAPSGRGEEVTVHEQAGTSRNYHVEARVGPRCRESVIIEARQNYGRVAGCMAGTVAGGAGGGALGVALADGDEPGTGALLGVGIGALLGLFCFVGGYEAPEQVDLDVSHCKPETETAQRSNR